MRPEYIIAAAVLLLIATVLAATSKWRRKRKIRRTVRKMEFISSTEFEKNWITDKSGNKSTDGYKCIDGSGCYVILVFSSPVRGRSFSGYENIYIGQSLNVCQRVHNHFNGKGNGNIFADIREGKSVYVQLMMCRKKEMNDLEKQLIEAFDATKSYNVTKGGGKKR